MHKIAKALENRLFFRDQLRNARNKAIADAEDFRTLLFVFERLGAFLIDRNASLKDYEACLITLAKHSALSITVPRKHRALHSPVSVLFEMLTSARNEALHQGADARHLTDTAIRLALVLEDALMAGAKQVSDFMVRDVVCAELWQPISFIRQQMLENSFSFLPVKPPAQNESWQLISDVDIAKYLGQKPTVDRKDRLATTLQDVLAGKGVIVTDQYKGMVLNKTTPVFPDESASDAILKITNQPILVVRNDESKELIGILTAFDLL